MLDLLLKRGGARQAAMPALLDLSQPSVARLVGSFQADGLVHIAGRAPEGRGNPSAQISLNSDYAYSLGIGLVGDAITMALLDLTGQVRAARAEAMPSMSPALVIPRLVALKAELIRAAGIDASRIIGAGVGFSGFFVGDQPRFNPPTQLRDWAGIDLADALSGPLGLSVICENDGTAAAIAESLLGIGRRCSNFAYCHLTNGFGGGIIVDGRPLRGALGNAGDFGGILWFLDDGYPSLDRLLHRVTTAGGDDSTVEDMVRRIGPDTPGVAEWISESERPISKLAFLLGHILAPEKIVIGGRLPHAVAAALATAVTMPTTPSRNGMPFPLPEIVASELDGDAAAIGAAAMPLQQIFFG